MAGACSTNSVDSGARLDGSGSASVPLAVGRVSRPTSWLVRSGGVSFGFAASHEKTGGNGFGGTPNPASGTLALPRTDWTRFLSAHGVVAGAGEGIAGAVSGALPSAATQVVVAGVEGVMTGGASGVAFLAGAGGLDGSGSASVPLAVGRVSRP